MCRGSSSSDGNIRKESGNLVAYSTVLPNNSLSFGVVCSFTSQQHKEEKTFFFLSFFPSAFLSTGKKIIIRRRRSFLP